MLKDIYVFIIIVGGLSISLSALLWVVVTTASATYEIIKCEATLPRDQHCVLTAVLEDRP